MRHFFLLKTNFIEKLILLMLIQICGSDICCFFLFPQIYPVTLKLGREVLSNSVYFLKYRA